MVSKVTARNNRKIGQTIFSVLRLAENIYKVCNAITDRTSALASYINYSKFTHKHFHRACQFHTAERVTIDKLLLFDCVLIKLLSMNGPMSPSSDALTLWHILANHLILLEVCPVLPVSALLALAATSRSFSRLIYNTPGVFRYLKLSTTHGQPPRSEVKTLYATDYKGWIAGGLTPRDQYAQDLLNVFDFLRQKAVLQDVTTLVLDGLNFPSALLSEVLCSEAFKIRLLSIRRVKLLGEDAVQRVLRYLIRPSRPEGSPKLQGIYCFDPISKATSEDIQSLAAGVTTTAGAQLGTRYFETGVRAKVQRDNKIEPWYNGCGRILSPFTVDQTWADLLQACVGTISFNAVLCRHCLQTYVRPRIATVSLRGCASCNSAPEGAAYPGASPVEHLPLISPPPLYESTVRAAQSPSTSGGGVPAFFARCEESLQDRWCQICNIW